MAVVELDRQVLLRLPIHTLKGIVTFGNVMTSPFLLGLCAERGVCVSMFSEQGKFLARVEGPVSGNVLLRLAQMRAYEDKDRKGDLARSFAIGKLYNSRAVLMRRMRDHGETETLKTGVACQLDVLRRVRDSPPDAARIRGLEGEAAAGVASMGALAFLVGGLAIRLRRERMAEEVDRLFQDAYRMELAVAAADDLRQRWSELRAETAEIVRGAPLNLPWFGERRRAALDAALASLKN